MLSKIFYKSIFIILLFIFLFSCDNKFPEYKKQDIGIYHKLISFEESTENYRPNKYVKASIQFFDNDKLIYKHYKEDVLKPASHNFDFLLTYLASGDSASFMIDKSMLIKQIPLLNNVNFKSKFIRAETKVYEYFSDGNNVSDDEMIEQILLKRYMKENVKATYLNGIYKVKLNEGKGPSIKQGSDIRIHYKAFFINRLQFDNTYKTKDFRFTYGTPGQVIKGLSIALKGMKKGEKAKIIIPSQLAFGEEGSSTQVVPPFTTVIYELEIVNVK